MGSGVVAWLRRHDLAEVLPELSAAGCEDVADVATLVHDHRLLSSVVKAPRHRMKLSALLLVGDPAGVPAATALGSRLVNTSHGHGTPGMLSGRLPHHASAPAACSTSPEARTHAAARDRGKQRGAHGDDFFYALPRLFPCAAGPGAGCGGDAGKAKPRRTRQRGAECAAGEGRGWQHTAPRLFPGSRRGEEEVVATRLGDDPQLFPGSRDGRRGKEEEVGTRLDADPQLFPGSRAGRGREEVATRLGDDPQSRRSGAPPAGTTAESDANEASGHPRQVFVQRSPARGAPGGWTTCPDSEHSFGAPTNQRDINHQPGCPESEHPFGGPTNQHNINHQPGCPESEHPFGGPTNQHNINHQPGCPESEHPFGGPTNQHNINHQPGCPESEHPFGGPTNQHNINHQPGCPERDRGDSKWLSSSRAPDPKASHAKPKGSELGCDPQGLRRSSGGSSAERRPSAEWTQRSDLRPASSAGAHAGSQSFASSGERADVGVSSDETNPHRTGSKRPETAAGGGIHSPCSKQHPAAQSSPVTPKDAVEAEHMRGDRCQRRHSLRGDGTPTTGQHPQANPAADDAVQADYMRAGDHCQRRHSLRGDGTPTTGQHPQSNPAADDAAKAAWDRRLSSPQAPCEPAPVQSGPNTDPSQAKRHQARPDRPDGRSGVNRRLSPPPPAVQGAQDGLRSRAGGLAPVPVSVSGCSAVLSPGGRAAAHSVACFSEVPSTGAQDGVWPHGRRLDPFSAAECTSSVQSPAVEVSCGPSHKRGPLSTEVRLGPFPAAECTSSVQPPAVEVSCGPSHTRAATPAPTGAAHRYLKGRAAAAGGGQAGSARQEGLVHRGQSGAPALVSVTMQPIGDGGAPGGERTCGPHAAYQAPSLASVSMQPIGDEQTCGPHPTHQTPSLASMPMQPVGDSGAPCSERSRGPHPAYQAHSVQGSGAPCGELTRGPHPANQPPSLASMPMQAVGDSERSRGPHPAYQAPSPASMPTPVHGSGAPPHPAHQPLPLVHPAPPRPCGGRGPTPSPASMPTPVHDSGAPPHLAHQHQPLPLVHPAPTRACGGRGPTPSPVSVPTPVHDSGAPPHLGHQHHLVHPAPIRACGGRGPTPLASPLPPQPFCSSPSALALLPESRAKHPYSRNPPTPIPHTLSCLAAGEAAEGGCGDTPPERGTQDSCASERHSAWSRQQEGVCNPPQSNASRRNSAEAGEARRDEPPSNVSQQAGPPSKSLWHAGEMPVNFRSVDYGSTDCDDRSCSGADSPVRTGGTGTLSAGISAECPMEVASASGSSRVPPGYGGLPPSRGLRVGNAGDLPKGAADGRAQAWCGADAQSAGISAEYPTEGTSASGSSRVPRGYGEPPPSCGLRAGSAGDLSKGAADGRAQAWCGADAQSVGISAEYPTEGTSASGSSRVPRGYGGPPPSCGLRAGSAGDLSKGPADGRAQVWPCGSQSLASSGAFGDAPAVGGIGDDAESLRTGSKRPEPAAGGGNAAVQLGGGTARSGRSGDARAENCESLAGGDRTPASPAALDQALSSGCRVTAFFGAGAACAWPEGAAGVSCFCWLARGGDAVNLLGGGGTVCLPFSSVDRAVQFGVRRLLVVQHEGPDAPRTVGLTMQSDAFFDALFAKVTTAVKSY
ncbi:hypothetical protein DIPPA_07052 [Diplonema papillatum]|nr:hypothetical protein DIPPA_07052 [Diplonema papillatum]